MRASVKLSEFVLEIVQASFDALFWNFPRLVCQVVKFQENVSPHRKHPAGYTSRSCENSIIDLSVVADNRKIEDAVITKVGQAFAPYRTQQFVSPGNVLR